MLKYDRLKLKEVVNMNQKKIGEFLRRLRQERQITQEELANALNVNHRTISRWENGRNLPDYDVMLEIASYYEVGVDEILNGEKHGEKIPTLKWYRKVAVMDSVNYYAMSALFIVLSIALNCLFYHLGLFGEDEGALFIILKEFLYSFMTPLDIIIILVLLIAFIFHLKTRFKNLKEHIVILLWPFHVIFISIILAMFGFMFYLHQYAPVPSLFAFVSIFLDATILFYGYVVRGYKIVDRYVLMSGLLKNKVN